MEGTALLGKSSRALSSALGTAVSLPSSLLHKDTAGPSLCCSGLVPVLCFHPRAQGELLFSRCWEEQLPLGPAAVWNIWETLLCCKEATREEMKSRNLGQRDKTEQEETADPSEQFDVRSKCKGTTKVSPRCAWSWRRLRASSTWGGARGAGKLREHSRAGDPRRKHQRHHSSCKILLMQP